MPLDLDRPYDEVIGIPGVKFMQGPNYFAVDGHPMLIEQGNARRATAEEMPPPLQWAAQPTSEPTVNYDAMSTPELKAALAVYGETWANRTDAIAFLRDAG